MKPASQARQTGSFVIRHETHKQFLSLFALVSNKQTTVHRHVQTAVILHDGYRNMPDTYCLQENEKQIQYYDNREGTLTVFY